MSAAVDFTVWPTAIFLTLDGTWTRASNHRKRITSGNQCVEPLQRGQRLRFSRVYGGMLKDAAETQGDVWLQLV